MGASSGYYWLQEAFPPTQQRYLPHYRHARIARSSSQDTQLAVDRLV